MNWIYDNLMEDKNDISPYVDYILKETESDKAERIRILRKNKLARIINEMDI